MYCAKCGAELKEGSNFCGKCGAQIAGRITTEVAEKETNNSGNSHVDKAKIKAFLKTCADKNLAMWKYIVNKIPPLATYVKEKVADRTTAFLSGAALACSLVVVCLASTVWISVAGTNESQEYVDLGLPSGTLWATCNIGATSPEEYGDYFAWGETEPKSNFQIIGYKMFYSKAELDPENDAAYVNWGKKWRMPSLDQFNELINYCTCTWTTVNGVNGRLITSNMNGKSIFLPAAGYREEKARLAANTEGAYWSRTLRWDSHDRACGLYIKSANIYTGNSIRSFGHTVRPVRNK